MSPKDLNNFLANYYIGFVFYDSCRFEYINTYNYETAPSGKLFQYFNAGVPVVTSNVKGLNAVKQYGAGIMIDNLNSKSIKEAVDKISANYVPFAEAAKKASAHFDFSGAAEVFIDFLK